MVDNSIVLLAELAKSNGYEFKSENGQLVRSFLFRRRWKNSGDHLR